MDSCYTWNMKKIIYDKNGIGITEMMALSLYHPMLFIVISCLINHNLSKLALKLARMIV